jgi:hypothetical protein
VAIIVARTPGTTTHAVRRRSGVSKGCCRSLPTTQTFSLLQGQDTNPSSTELNLPVDYCLPWLRAMMTYISIHTRRWIDPGIQRYPDGKDFRIPALLQYWQLPTALRVMERCPAFIRKLDRSCRSIQRKRCRPWQCFDGDRGSCNDGCSVFPSVSERIAQRHIS